MGIRRTAMGALKGFIKFCAWGICVLAVGWTLLIFATAKVLGNAVFVAESDAYVALALNALAVPALILLMVSARRSRNRLKKQSAAMATSVYPTPAGQYAGYGQPAVR
jgi:hypothetical protein